ncbi:carbohydrate ABC transporter permease [Lachnospiraceae bacterium CLA-AA-H183]|jgi:putative aldouronate transport system permease protein|uniref:carbohydrate ABC transporter permease n=1 Tax=Acetatifactor sp. TaxID=1872090 RepID=UPI000E467EF1|nr:carbohydrate ABC transporter permease [Firmicutes bacterium AM59-13]
MKRKLNSEKIFRSFAFVVLLILAIVCILPIILIIVASFTDETTLLANGYRFFPQKYGLEAYVYLLKQSVMMLRAYKISILVTVIGTLASLVLSTTFAYPLSRKDFKYRNIFSFLVFFTMLFSGGIVPSYMMWTKFFHIKDTIWALIIPSYLMNAFNILLIRNYYSNNIPDALVEAARIDGASEFLTFRRVIVPLSVPVIATVGLFTGLAYWNDWINGLYYINDPGLYSIQNLLIRLMNNIQYLNSGAAAGIVSGGTTGALPSTSVRMAIAVVGVIPVVAAYPFLQKYLIRGTVIGAVKG